MFVAYSTTSQTWKTPIVVVVRGGEEGADLVGILLYNDDDEQRLKDMIIIVFESKRILKLDRFTRIVYLLAFALSFSLLHKVTNSSGNDFFVVR